MLGKTGHQCQMLENRQPVASTGKQPTNAKFKTKATSAKHRKQATSAKGSRTGNNCKAWENRQ